MGISKKKFIWRCQRVCLILTTRFVDLRSLYGSKQASRQWFELRLQGFVQSKYHYSLFLNRNLGLTTIATIYVNGIILTGDNVHEIAHIKSLLDKIFSIKDLGKLHYFLGLEVGYQSEGIVLLKPNSQENFWKNVVFRVLSQFLLLLYSISNSPWMVMGVLIQILFYSGV